MGEDGPEPKINFLPAQKRSTAADKFQEHQEEHESRAKSSTDRMKAVQEQNSSFPQMKEELDRRRSTAEVRPFRISSKKINNSNRDNSKNTQCSFPNKRPSRRKKRPQRSFTNAKISKAKSKLRLRHTRCNCSKCVRSKKTNRCKLNLCGRCQVSSQVHILYKKTHGQPAKTDNSLTSGCSTNNGSKVASMATVSSKLSVSSYHSYMSDQHEPMVD